MRPSPQCGFPPLNMDILFIGAGRVRHAKTSGKCRWSKSMSLAEVASINPRRVESDPDVAATSVAGVMAEIGARARAAARILALAPTAQKDAALAAMAQALRDCRGDILAAN